MWIERRRVGFMRWEGSWCKCEVQNPNVEIRKPKQIRMTKFETNSREKKPNRITLWPSTFLGHSFGFALAALALSAVLALPQCGAAEVRVFAAASLTDSMKEVASAYEKASGDKVVFNFGASSV